MLFLIFNEICNQHFILYVKTKQYIKSLKYMGNRGTRFVRKVWESEEGQASIPRISVASANKYEMHNSNSCISGFHIMYEFKY